MGSETWEKCEIELFRPDTAEQQASSITALFLQFIKRFSGDNIGHLVADFRLFYGSKYC